MQNKSQKGYSNCHKGIYLVKNTNKYIGDKPPQFRSNWERVFMSALDNSNKVLAWASEQPEVPYVHPVRSMEEGRQIVWNYHPDFFVKLTDGTKVWYEMLEIKPSKQTKMPKPACKGRSKILVENESKTYAVNVAKWEQAIKVCEEKGWAFRIITENTIRQYITTVL